MARITQVFVSSYNQQKLTSRRRHHANRLSPWLSRILDYILRYFCVSIPPERASLEIFRVKQNTKILFQSK